MKIVLLISLLFSLKCFAQEKECDWQMIENLGILFQNNIGPQPLINEDRNSPFLGQRDTTSSVAIDLIQSNYFEQCLKGETRELFLKLFGFATIRKKDEVNCFGCHSQLEYSLQLYTKQGKPLDPLPSTLFFSFDENDRAIYMEIIAY